MNKVSDLHEQYTPRDEIEREGYVRQKFEVSGKGFEFTFSDKVVDLMKVLQHCERQFYPTWQEASGVAAKLGIRTKEEYYRRYMEDERLPSSPSSMYSDFPDWSMFLRGEMRKNYYPTLDQARKSVQKLGIVSYPEYKRRFKEDSRLPSNPNREYRNFPGYRIFLGVSKKKYRTWQEASRAALKLGIDSLSEYRKRRKEDLALPGDPNFTYSDFPGYRVFFGRNFQSKYQSCILAAKAARKLGIHSASDYKQRYKQDPLLPGNPYGMYEDFPGWPQFLGKK